MKKLNIIIAALVVLLITVTGLYIRAENENNRRETMIDELFMTGYNNLTLNMLNSTIDGIGEDVIHMYNVENTRWSTILTNFYQHTSFYKNKNSDLNFIIAILTQSTGYEAITEIEMDEELYHKLKIVPGDDFNNEEILKTARLGIEEALKK